jgi:hypothetical protein
MYSWLARTAAIPQVQGTIFAGDALVSLKNSLAPKLPSKIANAIHNRGLLLQELIHFLLHYLCDVAK